MGIFNKSNYSLDMKSRARLKNGLLLAGIFVLWVLTATYSDYGETGSTNSLVIFFGGFLMGAVAFLVCFFIPNERGGTLKAYKANMAGFCLYLIILKTFSVLASGSVAYVNGIFQLSLFIYPLGFTAWEAKKFMYLLGIGKSRRDSIDYYKDHGNDGTM